MSRAEQKKQRRELILTAGLDQFIRRGYSATKIKDIAAAADMSVGLLFHYFDSKEALFTELISLGVTAPQEMLKGFGQMEPLAFFELCARQTLQFAAASSFMAKMFVLMSNAYYSEGIPEQAKTLANGAHIYHDMIPIIEAGQKNGSIRTGNPLSLSIAFWSAIQGSIQLYALNPEFPLPDPECFVAMLRAEN